MDTPTHAPPQHREQLFGRTQSLCIELDDDADTDAVNAYLDAKVREDSGLFALAQAAGGRWLVADMGLKFVPW